MLSKRWDIILIKQLAEINNINNPLVAKIFAQYQKNIKQRLLILRELIISTAKDLKIAQLEETLKWGEHSYLCDSGSTIRINWNKNNPNHYAIYFNCKTTLVETFKEIYPDVFTYEGNRAIVFNTEDEIPTIQLQHCIELSLSYHEIKHLPLLGV